MKLKDARLCLDCDCVYDSQVNPLWQEICPECGLRKTVLLADCVIEKQRIQQEDGK